MTSDQMMSGFRNVDAAGDPTQLVRYLLDVAEAPHMRALSEHRLTRSAIAPGQVVADLGCGLGGDTIMLARRVAPGGGRAVGLDRSQAMLDFARARPEAAGLPVEFREGDVTRLPFADGELDACWMERVLIHVADPPAALQEILRVLRPGGQAVLREFDYRTFSFDSDDHELVEMMGELFRAALLHPRMGCELPRLCRAAGFSRVEVEPGLLPMPTLDWIAAAGRWREHLATLVDSGRITEDRAEAWWRFKRDAAAEGALLGTMITYTVYATR